MNTTPIKLLALGGSNTFMLKGYMASLRDALKIPPENIRNLALGANSCLMGLISLASETEIENPDVVVIEYAVNDYALLVAGQASVWVAAYEGLVRQVSRRFPEALICCVILGRSDSQPGRWNVITEGTTRIAANYANTVVVDCPRTLSKYFTEIDGDTFSDPLHYGERARTAAGLLVADAIKAAPQPTARPLPAPIDSDALDPVAVVDFSRLRPEGRQTFENSVVSTDCLRLEIGSSISVELPGPLIAISFISRKDGGSFLMRWNDKSALVHTLHDQVESGNFPFLPLSAVGNWWKEPNAPGQLMIEPISNCADPADWPVYHVGPTVDGAAAVYLHQLLVRVA
jgi:hypothetical protein